MAAPLPAATLWPYIRAVTGPDPLLVFDRAMLRRRRERAARDWDRQAFLKREIADRLVERLDDVRRTFPLALDLGSHGDEIAAALGERAAVGCLVRADLGHGFARRARGPAVVADEEFLPFAPESFDLVVSAMDLHWVNDLPGTLIQIGRILKPDGLFLGAMLGGATLWQLRQALAAAESEIEGGLSPRVSPFADLRDAAGLLQRAGFALPVADSETIEVEYDECARPDARPGRHGRKQSRGRTPPRLRAPRHVAARGGNLRRAVRAAVRAGSPRASRCCSCTAGRRMPRSPSRSSRAAPRGGWPTRWAPPSRAPARKWSGARSCLS